MATKADMERYAEMAQVLGLDKNEIMAFCREQADIERKVRYEERKKQWELEEWEKQRELEDERETEGEAAWSTGERKAERIWIEECCDYENLKEALRKRYRLTEGGFWTRFRKRHYKNRSRDRLETEMSDYIPANVTDDRQRDDRQICDSKDPNIT